MLVDQAKPKRVEDPVLEFAVSALGVVLLLVVLGGWFVKAQADLSWDEAMNQRVYARHPLTALALYHEPNNHVLESFWKSLFYWGLGLDRPPWRRLPAVIVAGVFLFLVFRGIRRRLRRRSILGAATFGLLLLASATVNDHAIELRGYFPSMMLMLALAELSTSAGSPLGLRRLRVLLAAAMIFTLPTNVFFALPLLYWSVLEEEGTENKGLADVLCRTWALAWRSLTLAFLLYLPLIVGLALGISHHHGALPEALPFMAACDRVLGLARPAGFSTLSWSLVLAAGLLAGLARRGRPGARSGLMLLALVGLSALAAQLVLATPERVLVVTVPATACGLALIVEALSSGWSRRCQVMSALLLALLISVPAIPALVELTRSEALPRPVTDLMARLEERPDLTQGKTLFVHEANSILRLELEQAFGSLLVVGSPIELADHQVEERASTPGLVAGLKARILPPAPQGLDLDAVETVVLVRDRLHRGNYAFDRSDFLGPLLEGRHLREEFAIDRFFVVEIWTR